MNLSFSFSVGPGREQEELRRKVENGVKELWYFIHSEIQKLSHINPTDRQKHTDALLQDLGHQQRSDAIAYNVALLLLRRLWLDVSFISTFQKSLKGAYGAKKHNYAPACAHTNPSTPFVIFPVNLKLSHSEMLYIVTSHCIRPRPQLTALLA